MRKLSRKFVGFAVMVALLGLFATSGPVSASRDDAGHDWIATFSSSSEVPVNASGTWGIVWMHINDDGQSMTWSVWVSAITNPVGAHIHLGGPGVNGPIVLSMYTGKEVGPVSGVMATGTATAKDLEGPLKGKTMDDLFAAIKSGNAYFNIHTSVSPGGEARGVIHSDEIGRLGN